MRSFVIFMAHKNSPPRSDALSESDPVTGAVRLLLASTHPAALPA